MKPWWLLLLPIHVISSQVELVHNFSSDPASQSIFETNKDTPWAQLREFLGEKKIKLVSSDLHSQGDASHFVFWNMPPFAKQGLKQLPKQKLILFLWEPPVVDRHLYKKKLHHQFSRIYTWDDDLVDNRTYFKFHYPVLHPMQHTLPKFEEKKLCCLITMNKKSKHPQELYSEREKVIRFFEKKQTNDFEFYGYGWEKTPYKNYKGTIVSKQDTLKNYRFSFCYENMQGVKGYVTEKIFDCFSAGCVPIYLGASNIEKYVPANCMIDRRKFNSEQEVYDFLKKMTKEEYEGYLANIRLYLKSKQAQVFSSEHFIQTFYKAISN